MRKITTGAKSKPSTRASLRHLFYQNPQHEKDRKKAQLLRSRQSIFLPKMYELLMKSSDFPRASEVAFLVGISDQKATVFDPTPDPETGSDLRPEVVDFWHKIHEDRAYYIRKDKKKKDGSFYQRKQATNGVKECTISLPIGWTKVLKTAIETGLLSPAGLSQDLQEIGQLLLQEMHSRTGYEPLFLALHPDSETNMQFHLGLGSVDPITREPLGRSGTGERGKKSIREAGTCFLNVWRHAKKAVLNPQQLEKFEKENLCIPRLAFQNAHTDWDGHSLKTKDGLPLSYDDVALAVKLESLLKERFPEQAKTAEEVSVDFATNWVIEALNSGPTKADLRQSIEEKEEEIVTKREELLRLKQHIADVKQKIAQKGEEDNEWLMGEVKSAISEETKKLEADVAFWKDRYQWQKDNPLDGLTDKEINFHIKKYQDGKQAKAAPPV
jgi:hypothetical protein